MLDDTKPQVLGGAPLPSVLDERWTGGFAPVQGVGEWNIHVGGENVPDVKRSEGYVPVADNARGANILWSEEAGSDPVSGVVPKAKKSLTAVENPPRPLVNMVDRIHFDQGINDDGTDNGVWYFEYNHAEDGPISFANYGVVAKVKGRVDEDGVLDIAVRSVGDQSQRVSADDLMMNVIQGLKQRGVPVYEVQAQFDYIGRYSVNTTLFKRALQHQLNMGEKALGRTDHGDARPSAWERPRSPDLETLFEMTTPQQHIEAAKRTHAGRFLQRYRFSPSDVRLGDVGVMVQFKGNE